MKLLWVSLLLGLAFRGLWHTPEPAAAAFCTELSRHRAEKDSTYFADPDSPIPTEAKAEFRKVGLAYYPCAEQYRFTCKLEALPPSAPLRVGTSAGITRNYHAAYRVRFVLEGNEHSLIVYKPVDPPRKPEYRDYHWLPFLDATSGKDTYGGGRYLELFITDTTTTVTVDFNRAYNPLCAYGRGVYACPKVPENNRLPIAITAGEKNYPLEVH